VVSDDRSLDRKRRTAKTDRPNFAGWALLACGFTIHRALPPTAATIPVSPTEPAVQTGAEKELDENRASRGAASRSRGVPAVPPVQPLSSVGPGRREQKYHCGSWLRSGQAGYGDCARKEGVRVPQIIRLSADLGFDDITILDAIPFDEVSASLHVFTAVPQGATSLPATRCFPRRRPDHGQRVSRRLPRHLARSALSRVSPDKRRGDQPTLPGLSLRLITSCPFRPSRRRLSFRDADDGSARYCGSTPC